jgi:hypothetical protein
MGKCAHFYSSVIALFAIPANPSSYINMHGGYREFCENVRHNAIKRFFNEKLAVIGNIIDENF